MKSIKRCILQDYRQLNYSVLHSIRSLSQTHYEVLGVSNTASQKEIKAAYKNLCKQLHPDVNKNDPKTHDKFIQLKEAYTVVGKSMTRKEYDMRLQTRPYTQRNQNIMDNSTYGQGSTNKEDAFYTYPQYEEILWNRRWNPEKYSRPYGRWEKESKPVSLSWVYIVLGGVVLNMFIFWWTYRGFKSNLDERDRKAAETWKFTMKNQSRLLKEAEGREAAAYARRKAQE